MLPDPIPRLTEEERKHLRTTMVGLSLWSPFMLVLSGLNAATGFIGGRVWTLVALGSAVCGFLGLRSLWLVRRYDTWIALSRRIRRQIDAR